MREALIKMGHAMSPVDKPRVVARGTTQMIVIDQKTGAMIGGAAPQGRDNLDRLLSQERSGRGAGPAGALPRQSTCLEER